MLSGEEEEEEEEILSTRLQLITLKVTYHLTLIDPCLAIWARYAVGNSQNVSALLQSKLSALLKYNIEGPTKKITLAGPMLYFLFLCEK